MENSRYIVGIDLGTTNSVISYIHTEEETTGEHEAYSENRIFKVPQVTDPGIVEELDLLPSFFYIPAESELPDKSLSLPWSDDRSFTVGSFAKKRGAEVPLRLVSSAKSWLCHPGVDRTSSILPWTAPESITKYSPIDVSSYYIEHIRLAWNDFMAEGKPENFLENQEVFLTVPASFDAVARDLTVKAAEKAGLGNITLLEEPQAAFYAWVHKQKDEWRKKVKVGDVILVCDIGGGTTDYSLIEVVEEDGDLALKRIAVGEHVLLGGDNMDLTIAYAVRKRFSEKGIKIDSHQMLELIHNCREAKEKMLNDPECQTLPVVVLGRGRSVIGGTIQEELDRSDVETIIVDGFFPHCSVEDSPAGRRAAGIKELGLHYATDTAVTKYLSKFLRQHIQKIDNEKRAFLHPTKILFNGGVSKASEIRNRMVDVMNHWLSSDHGEPVNILEGDDPDMAVAIGAAYYGFAKRGKGVRIRAGASRSYYVGIETSMPAVPGMPVPIKALCVVSFGMEEGTDAEIPEKEFGLAVGEHAVFRFLSSTIRKDDMPGTMVEEWDEDEIIELAPLEAMLSAESVEKGTLVPVKLHSYLTETGTLELWCEAVDGHNKWKLEFHVREES